VEDLEGAGRVLQGDATLFGGAGGQVVFSDNYVGIGGGPTAGAAIGVSLDGTVSHNWFSFATN
jgi:hypothetical protein